MAHKRILIVDDEESLTDILKLTLEDAGEFEVRTENHAEEVVNVARWFSPDIIVLDVIMPEMSGLEVADQLREELGEDTPPILFLTAAVSKEDVNMQHELLKNCPVMAKPVGTQELIQQIEKMLAAQA
jgi:DNA-binding response OmpR family regulator